jgi:hypothetical protein
MQSFNTTVTASARTVRPSLVLCLLWAATVAATLLQSISLAAKLGAASEALLLTFLLSSDVETRRRLGFALLSLATLVQGALLVGTGLSGMGVDSLAAARSLASTTTRQMLVVAAGVALRMFGPSSLVGLGLAIGLVRALLHNARGTFVAIAVAAATLSGSLQRDDSTARFDPRLVETAFPVAAPPSALRPARVLYPQVILVVLESVGADNLAPLVADGGALEQWAHDSLFVPEAIGPSNTSHMNQPALLFSRDFSPSALPSPKTVRPPQPLFGVADWFHAAGYRTLMVSSQDESWLGLDQVVLRQSWDLAVDSRITVDSTALYRDACGTQKVLDSHSLRRFILEMQASKGPTFGYLNLQNTHFPYLIEGAQDPRDFQGLDCSNFYSLQNHKLSVAKARYSNALRESTQRLEELRRTFPDALFAIVGDHGEELIGGGDFAHSKNLTAMQVASSFFLRGPQLTPRRIEERRSLLDLLPTLVQTVDPEALRRLPHGIWDGLPVSVHRDTQTYFAIGHGVPRENTAIRGDVQLRKLAKSFICQQWGIGSEAAALPLERCAGLEDLLERWLACQTFFSRADQEGARTHFNPCNRALGSGEAKP